MIGIWTAGEYSDHYAGFVDLGDDPRKRAFFVRFTKEQGEVYESAVAERFVEGDVEPMRWGAFLEHYDVRSMHASGCEMRDGPMQFAPMPPWPSPPKPDSDRRAWTERRAELVEEAGARCQCWQSEVQREDDARDDGAPDGEETGR